MSCPKCHDVNNPGWICEPDRIIYVCDNCDFEHVEYVQFIEGDDANELSM